MTHFKPCLLTPVYNHGAALPRVIEQLSAHGLPIYVTDDGSDAATQTVLRDIADQFPQVRLARLPVNQGKGAAVLDAMRRALRDGHTHGLQIDADGRHDSADVPRFLLRSRAEPNAVIAGKPIYDESVPKARLYGRYITHVWVWIETLSFDIADALCGYRLYPLGSTVTLAERVELGKRMDFDVDVIVRLSWAGIPVVSLPTRVTYPTDGVSHFDALRDNLLISRTHARLAFGMLPRIPRLLWQKRRGRSERDPANWSHIAERGSALGLASLAAAYRLLGRRAATILMLPVTAYFFLTSRRARAASRDYLERIFRHCGPSHDLPRAPGWRDTFRHFQAFAASALDKFAAWSGAATELSVDFPARAQLDALVASGRGAVLIGAHLGNFEIARALGTSRGVKGINAIVYSAHARRFTTLLAGASRNFGVNLLHVPTLGADDALKLQDKIDAGELIFIVGDRTPASENGRVTSASFLGEPAAFAQGPLLLARLLDCPVYLFFCLRQEQGYRIHLEPFAERITLPRKTREQALAEYVRRYAARLEHYCSLAPLQWFNFYDFWQAHEPTHRTAIQDSDHERTRTAHA